MIVDHRGAGERAIRSSHPPTPYVYRMLPLRRRFIGIFLASARTRSLSEPNALSNGSNGHFSPGNDGGTRVIPTAAQIRSTVADVDPSARRCPAPR